jgi:hypothetical protein
MSAPIKYESFPLPLVITRASLLLLTLAAGAVIFAGIGWVGLVLYLLLALLVVGANLTFVCRHCAYRGFCCDSGMSLLSTLLWGRTVLPAAAASEEKEAITQRFAAGARRVYPWFMLLLAAPLLVGVVQLLLSPTRARWPWVVAYFALVVLVMVTTVCIGCRHCRMSGICPLAGGGTTLQDIKEEMQPEEEILI